MTNEAFLGYFVGGLDILGHRVTARIGRPDPDRVWRLADTSSGPDQFLITINHRDEFPMTFDPDEPLSSRMGKVDAAVERWRLLRPKG